MDEKRFENSQELVSEITKSMIQDGKPHKAGELYERFVEQTGGIGTNGKQISRSEFETRLRVMVMQEDGFIKRTAFGVYQIRSSPEDRGLIVCNKPRQEANALEKNDWEILSGIAAQSTIEISTLEETLAATCKIAEKLRDTFQTMDQYPEIADDQKKELASIRKATLSQLDQAVTGISATIAWLEDTVVESTDGLTSEDENDFEGPVLGM